MDQLRLCFLFACMSTACASQASTPVAIRPDHTTVGEATPAGSETTATQSAPQGSSTAIFVGCGFLLVENHDRTHFTVKLLGKEPRQVPKEDHMWWILDNVLFESTVATAATMGDPTLRGARLLRRYLDWETRYASEQNGWPPIKPPAKEFEVDGRAALAWTVKYPAPVEVLDVQTTGALYITVAVDNVVLGLAAPRRGRHDIEPATHVMFDAIQTVEQTTEPTDVHALSQEIEQLDESVQWSGCSG